MLLSNKSSVADLSQDNQKGERGSWFIFEVSDVDNLLIDVFRGSVNVADAACPASEDSFLEITADLSIANGIFLNQVQGLLALRSTSSANSEKTGSIKCLSVVDGCDAIFYILGLVVIV